MYAYFSLICSGPQSEANAAEADADDAELVTAGGRVLSVTAVGASFVEARALAYAGVAQIAFDGMHYRTDIGHRALRRIEEAAAAEAAAESAESAAAGGSVCNGQRAPLRVAVLGSTRGTALQPLIDLLERQTQRLRSVSDSSSSAASASSAPTSAPFASSAADEPMLNAAICLVVSNKADAPILERARRHSLPTALLEAKGRAREAVDEELSALLRAHQIDLVLLVGYMRILSAPFARAWAGKVLNVHPSLLPAFAGGMDLQVCVMCVGNHIMSDTIARPLDQHILLSFSPSFPHIVLIIIIDPCLFGFSAGSRGCAQGRRRRERLHDSRGGRGRRLGPDRRAEALPGAARGACACECACVNVCASSGMCFEFEHWKR
jgi:folate-dependent phosphoribosylglycinamide formyltransferase PurN